MLAHLCEPEVEPKGRREVRPRTGLVVLLLCFGCFNITASLTSLYIAEFAASSSVAVITLHGGCCCTVLVYVLAFHLYLLFAHGSRNSARGVQVVCGLLWFITRFYIKYINRINK